MLECCYCCYCINTVKPLHSLNASVTKLMYTFTLFIMEIRSVLPNNTATLRLRLWVLYCLYLVSKISESLQCEINKGQEASSSEYTPSPPHDKGHSLPDSHHILPRDNHAESKFPCLKLAGPTVAYCSVSKSIVLVHRDQVWKACSSWWCTR